MTQRWERVVPGTDPTNAVVVAKTLARGEGYRIRTLVRVGYERAGDMPVRLPEYRVVLAVEPKVAVR